MRTTVTLDDELIRDAMDYTGIKEKTELLRAGLVSLIQAEAARRLAKLGGTDPGAKAPPRRRPR